jgi:hypothetical protein
MTTSDVRADADQILLLERAGLDRSGKGDPGGFLDVTPVISRTSTRHGGTRRRPVT